MKHLANKEIFNILSELKIENFTINGDGSVDVDGHINISDKNLDKIPVQFGYVAGDFRCGSNKLTSLVGAPIRLDGGFYCSGNSLTTLLGSPKAVAGNFYCLNNKLTRLVGSPKEVGGSFICSVNNLTSLEGAPIVVRNFSCDQNKLTSLVGSPKYVRGNFDCRHNLLTSLVGAPSEIGLNFNCDFNQLPKEIRDSYRDIKYIIKYQDLYSIWRKDGSLDKFRFQEMMKDIDI